MGRMSLGSLSTRAAMSAGRMRLSRRGQGVGGSLISAELSVRDAPPRRVRDGSVRWTWWAGAAAAALLSTSQWLHAPSVEYLVPLLIATAATIGTTALVPAVQRRWAIACSTLLALAAVLAVAAQRN